MKQTNTTNRRLVLAERPEGEPTESTLNLETTEIPSPQDGEMLLRTEFRSLDPYMRGRMSDEPSYAPPVEVGYLMGQILRKRITMRGFIIFEDFESLFPEFRAEMGDWLKAGKVHYREDFIDGLEQAPNAFIGMLEGSNFGKCVVRVGSSE